MNFFAYIYYQVLVWLDGWHPDDISRHGG